MNEEKYNYLLKFIMIGDTFVGKSNILSKFTNNKFNERHEITIGCEFMAKNILINEQNIRLQAGQEAFRSITRSYYKNSACALIVYDISNRDSFRNLESWLNECADLCSKTITLILVGNKCDLEGKRVIAYSEGEEYAKNNSMAFFETSALTGYNIDTMFSFAGRELIEKVESGRIDLSDESCGIKIRNLENSIPKEIFSLSKPIKTRKCCK